jgi:hypothetical protein
MMSDFGENIEPSGSWADVPSLSTEAVARGGMNGPMNAQAIALAKRSKYLKTEVEARVKREDLSSSYSGRGSDLVGFSQAAEGSMQRTVRAKLQDTHSLADYGAWADGVTDDTGAFERLEAAVKHSIIDLGGKTYQVTRDFSGNTYVNGQLAIGLQHLSKQMDRAPGVTAYPDQNYNSVQRYNIAEINGSTTSRGAQAFCFNERNRSLFVYEGGIITRFDADAGIDVVPLDSTTAVSSVLGHQGLACEYLEGDSSAFRLWITSAVVGRQAARFAYTADTPVTTTEEYTLFEVGVFANSTSCTPTISSCNRYLIAHGLRLGGDASNGVVRVWDLKKVIAAGPGDHTTTWMYQWDTQSLTDSTSPLQGTACDGAQVWLISGGTGPTAIKRLHAYTLDGVLISKEDDLTVGKAQAALDGDGSRWEPEGLAIGTGPGGGKYLYAGMLSGQPGVRRFRIYGINMARSFQAKTVNLVGNSLASISSSTSTGRKYLALRSGFDLSSGCGVNMYANGDNNVTTAIGGLNVFTNNATRMTVDGAGMTTLRADAAIPPLSLNGNGSGTIQELRRNGTEIGRIHISTADFFLTGIDNAEVRIGASPSVGATPVANWRNRQTDGSWGPMTDGTKNLGSTDFRLNTLWVASGPITTSDAREKTAVRVLSAAELAASKDLAKEIGLYKFLTAVAQKGDAAREHVGMYVQRAIEIFEAHGLNPFHYSFICFDEWPEQWDGDTLLRAAGSRYSFRMDGLVLFMLAGQEQRLSALEGMISQITTGN